MAKQIEKADAIVTDTDCREVNPELADAIIEYCKLSTELKAMEGVKDTLKDDIFRMAEKSGYEGKSFLNPQTGEVLQTVYSVVTKIDDDKVRKVVTPEIFEKITTRKVVPDLLRASIKMGEVIAREVADAFKDQTVRKLYIRPAK